jgi:GGDEF domain-containing protein
MCPGDGTTADGLVDHADMAMYEHKRTTKRHGGTDSA